MASFVGAGIEGREAYVEQRRSRARQREQVQVEAADDSAGGGGVPRVEYAGDVEPIGAPRRFQQAGVPPSGCVVLQGGKGAKEEHNGKRARLLGT